MGIKNAFWKIGNLKSSIAKRIPEKITDENFLSRLMNREAVSALEVALDIIREECPEVGVLEEDDGNQ